MANQILTPSDLMRLFQQNEPQGQENPLGPLPTSDPDQSQPPVPSQPPITPPTPFLAVVKPVKGTHTHDYVGIKYISAMLNEKTIARVVDRSSNHDVVLLPNVVMQLMQAFLDFEIYSVYSCCGGRAPGPVSYKEHTPLTGQPTLTHIAPPPYNFQLDTVVGKHFHQRKVKDVYYDVDVKNAGDRPFIDELEEVEFYPQRFVEKTADSALYRISYICSVCGHVFM